MKLHQHAQALESLDRAQAALDSGRCADTLKHIGDAIRLTPGSTAARIVEARVYLRLHDTGRALAALDAISLYCPQESGRIDVTLLRVQALIEAGRDEAALPLLDVLVQQCPSDAPVHRLAAGAAQRLHQPDRAIEHLRRIVALEPSDHAAARSLARLLAERDPQAGIEFMCTSASAAPLAARWQAARWMVAAGRYADAEESYRCLLEAVPDDANLWMEAGDHADRAGACEVAVRRYEHALRLPNVDAAAAAAGLARTLMHAGRFSASAWWWWKVTRSDAARIEAWAALVVCGLSADRPLLNEQAERRLEPLADEGQRMAAYADAWLHASSGDVIRHSTQPTKTGTETASPLTWILQRSADVLAQQNEMKPGWADTLYHTAVCRAALGENDEARDYVQAALDINPNYRAATTLAARLPKAA